MAISANEADIICRYLQLSRNLLDLRARRGPLSQRVEARLADERHDLWILLSQEAQLELQDKIEIQKREHAAWSATIFPGTRQFA